MVTRKIIQTENAPKAIGTYSQAVQVDNMLYLSGQVGFDPKTMTLVAGIEAQIHQVFQNLKAVVTAANAELKDVVKLTIYLTDLNHFPFVNEVMGQYFKAPYPARSTIGVAALPRGAQVEIEAIVAIPV